MYIDQNLLFADTLTGTTSAAATDYIDTKVISIKDGDAYKQMWWVVKTEAAFTIGAGAPTATFQLQTSEDATFVDSTTVTLAQTAAFTAAVLTANTIVSRMKVPLGLKRYIRVYKVVNNSGDSIKFTLGSYSTFLTTDVDANLP